MSGTGTCAISRSSLGPQVLALFSLHLKFSQARKKTKINFLGPETPGWGGGLPREGVVVEKFVPSLEHLSSLGLGGRNLGCPGNFAGMSRTLGGVQKVCAKLVRARFGSRPGSPRHPSTRHPRLA